MGRFLVPRRSQVVRWRGALEGLLPPDHLARFVWQVLVSLDFSAVEACYHAPQGGRGRSPYHPRLVAALWIYGMTQGLETAAAIAQACRLRDDFRWLAGALCPSDQTLLNFLSLVPDELDAIWTQVLEALHRAGHIDLSAVVEDGTKLRVNASRRSFHTAPEIKDILDALERQLATKLHALGEPPRSRADQRQVRALQGRIDRATQAAAELHQRLERRRPDPPGPRGDEPGAPVGEPVAAPVSPAPARPPLKFARSAFPHDAERNVLVCPAGKRLGFVGIYREPPRDSYRLYRATEEDCGACRLKAQCTAAPRRCVKIPTATLARPASPPAGPSDAPPDSSAYVLAPDPPAGLRRPVSSGPQASLTEPEALLMLATADKQWQPSYNADLTVTRHQFIIDQFLTKAPTDYASFGRALPAVLATVGRPEAWIGDGHYGTQENVLLAHRAGVVLYAPPAGVGPDAAPASSTGAAEEMVTEDVAPAGRTDGAGGDDRPRPTQALFCREDFRHDPDRDLLICPTGEPLRLIGVYAESPRAAYRIYGRRDCGACAVKPQCTTGRGRRVKLRVPPTGRSPTSPPTREPPTPRASAGALPPPSGPGEVAELVHALAARMRQIGDRIKAFRSATIEPVNAQLKQHGLGRFHVHGLSRCAIVLTLACIAHNLMKWKAREAARALSVPA